MDYEVLDGPEDIPITDLAEYDSVAADNHIRQLDAALALEHLRLKLWYFEPGEGVTYHAHLHQEEVFSVLAGSFELELGDPGDTDVRRVEEGAWWVAKPEVGHGHRYLGDDRGLVLAIGAPAVDDEPVDPTELCG